MSAIYADCPRVPDEIIVMPMILYGYGLSSASLQGAIALNLKRLPYASVLKNLRAGEHRLSEFLKINIQGLVPALGLDDGAVLTQSVAIMEYLDEIYPDPPLLPAEPLARARVRALTQVITSDLHPLNNLRVLRYLEEKLTLDKASRDSVSALGRSGIRCAGALAGSGRGHRAVLPRQFSDAGRHLSGAAGIQCTAIRRGYESFSTTHGH